MSSASTRTSTCPTRCSSTPSAAVILGIDPGTTGMGYAFLVAADARATIIECGIVDVRASSTAGERLLAISKALDDLIGRHRPAVLAVERLYFNKNAKTAMRVSEARGIALLCGARAGLEIAEYTPQEVKLTVAGHGAADKKAIQAMLPHLVALDAPVTQDNVADAIAIALTHLQRAKFTAAVAAAT
ncbi:MAG: crossover junction endodeoxyribonuclease RuvC [Chloroflexi bacterium]|nr:MAG: crossover junction endodeoxyribonuclease RuvC [Chloroflexota bacterium]